MTKYLQLEDTPEILLRPEHMEDMTNMINNKLLSYPNWKIVMVLNCVFERVTDVEHQEPIEYFLRSDVHQINSFVPISEVLEDCIDEILYRVEDLRLSNSGMKLKIHL